MIEVNLAKVLNPEEMIKAVYGKDSIDDVENISKAIDFMVLRTKKMMEKVDKVAKDEETKNSTDVKMSDEHAEKLKKLIRVALNEMVSAVNIINGTDYKVSISTDRWNGNSIDGKLWVAYVKDTGDCVPGIDTLVAEGYYLSINNFFNVTVDKESDLREVFKKVFLELVTRLMTHAMAVKSGVLINVIRNADARFKSNDRVFVLDDNEFMKGKVNLNALRKSDIKKLRNIDNPHLSSRYQSDCFIEIDPTTGNEIKTIWGSIVETSEGLVLIEMFVSNEVKNNPFDDM